MVQSPRPPSNPPSSSRPASSRCSTVALSWMLSMVSKPASPRKPVRAPSCPSGASPLTCMPRVTWPACLNPNSSRR
ncbi:pyridoxal biosynthesis protein pdx1.1 [Phtheirospermum japonicum]|uniref:Pyridoxal biosynthesis protein pdx1.1 n=1 Tax=Phtheirospermum japonicum TaxID=374723 RepID=A0A830CT33_9LAMI|nr:pyridoxal biosynthesis protein pdx1.1 [Phtheirospermum japonicum]